MAKVELRTDGENGAASFAEAGFHLSGMKLKQKNGFSTKGVT
jgi:hypothetical protein